MDKRVSVLGVGLIGGSVGLRLRGTGTASVIGYDPRPGVGEAALDRRAVDVMAETREDAVSGADLVIVAVPVDRMAETFAAIGPHVGPEAVVTDVGSTKQAVVEAGQAALGDRFVGGHPMAGSERHGVEAADPSLFEDAWWILTPTDVTSGRAYSRAAEFVAELGARPIALDPLAHDALVARLSHLPQLVATTLVGLVASDEDAGSLGLAANGFRDVTRIAASDPDLWLSILRSNREPILEALTGYADHLDRVRSLLAAGSWDDLKGLLSSARDARLELFAKTVYTGDPVALTMLIPDRPGVLAEVTTAAGALGANIEDISIFHSTEGGRGRLELVVAGEGAAAALVDRLGELGYHVDQGLPG